MIEILPIRDEDTLKQLNEKSGVDTKLGYCLYEKEKVEGWILYNILSKSEAEIYAVKCESDMEADALIRAVFSSLYDFAIDTVRFDKGVDNALLTRLNFVKAGESITPSVKEILYCCKNCSQK